MRIGIDASRAFVKNPTGTERYSYEVITRILKLPEAKKHTWILYTRNSPPAAAYPSLKLREGGGVSYKRINLPFLWTQAGLAYRTWVDRLDVLWIPAHTLPVLRKPGIKTVVTIHGIEYEWLPQYENWLQRWYLPLSTQYAVMRASRIIAVSEFTKKQLVERLHAKPEKIKVVHEGCNTAPSDPSPNLGEGRKGEVLEKYGLKSKKYLLFVGTVQPRKNLVRLIQAFSNITPRPPLNLRGGDNLKLVIVGKLGWNYQEVLEAPEKYGVKEQIVIVGYINDIERDIILHNALVYVQPSITEGFGLPVLDAFSAGIPVVSSNGGALPEIIGDAGMLFDPYDQLDILDKLAKVVSNHKLRKELMVKGNLRTRKFNWKIAANKTYNILINTHSK